MGRASALDKPDPAQGERWVFSFTIDGDLRFISHRDTLRLFGRALARASLPMRYSEGFNPHPRLSIPLPRPVGVASEAGALVVEFERPIDGDQALDKLSQQIPPDLRVVSARRLEAGERLRPALVRYRFDLEGAPDAGMESRVQRLRTSTVVSLERVNPKTREKRSINVRPYIAEIHADGHAIEFTLRVTGSGGVKPAEIAGLLGFDQRRVNDSMRCLEVQWEKGLAESGIGFP